MNIEKEAHLRALTIYRLSGGLLPEDKALSLGKKRFFFIRKEEETIFCESFLWCWREIGLRLMDQRMNSTIH